MPQIRISVNQNQIPIDSRQMKKAAGEILSVLGFTEVELSIVVVNDIEMARLNAHYRAVDGPTDVLAFPMWEGEFGDVCREMLGDVVISAETAARMADEHRVALESVLDLLLTHGILHLVGFDHEQGEDWARVMHDRTMEIMARLGHSGDTLAWYGVPDRGE